MAKDKNKKRNRYSADTFTSVWNSEDNPHKGFEAFVDILDKYKPKYFIHGHVHLNYSVENKREREYKDTIIINGYDRYVFEYPDKYILKGSGSDS